MHPNHQFRLLAVAAFLLTALYGCGGGGSSTTMTMSTEVPNDSVQTEPELVTASKLVVQAIPRRGSVTHSSNIDPVTKVTRDVIDVIFNNATGAVTINKHVDNSVQSYTLGAGTDGGRYVPDNSEEFGETIEIFGQTIQGTRVYQDPDPPAGTGSQLTDLLNQAGEVVFRDSDNGFAEKEEQDEGASPCHRDAGRCHVILTNKRALRDQGGADSTHAPRFDPSHLDYWTIGVWVSPHGAAQSELGAFAVPSSPLTASQLMSISRPSTAVNATYRGIEYSTIVSDKIIEIVGDLDLPSRVTLTATFGSAETPTVGGEIMHESELLTVGPGGWARDTIILEDAVIDTNVPGGFFKNTTSYSYAEGNAADGTVYETPIKSETGHWGGQFFGGLDRGDNNLPNSVTGTYASEMDRGNGRDKLRAVGAFVGHKQ